MSPATSAPPPADPRRTVLRYLCLATALANAGGNVLILLFYRPIFELLGVPLPRDLFSFAFVSGFSFTMGILSFMIFLAPERSLNLLVVGIVGKGIYAFFTSYFYDQQQLHWFYRVFGLWDGAFVLVFLLFLIHLAAADLDPLNRGEVRPGRAPSTGRALLLYYSLTDNGRGTMTRLAAGLRRKGYQVDELRVVPEESLFHFPMSLVEFVRIMLRAIFRRPARIKPLGLAADHPYDLIVVECQTWFIGMGAPLEAVFQDPANQALFAGRDVAAVTVCRGLWRRTQAMTIRWLEHSGGTVVGARAYTNPGWEPARTFSLFLFLGFGAPGRPRFLRGWFLQPQQVSEASLADVERFGEQLAERRGPRQILPTAAREGRAS